METRRSQFAIKLLPSLTDFAFLMPIVFLFGRMDGVKTLLGDCDTGWHIRTGEWILAHGWVPARDIFSFSKPGAPWFAWEWLSDVVFAKLNAWGGLQAVVLFSILLLSVTFTALFLQLRRQANPIVAISVTMLAAAASSIHWLARPHLFTLFFLVLFYAALERVRAGRPRLAGIPYLVILPAVTVLWTNLHGGFFVGALMIAAFGAGELLTIAFSADTSLHVPAWRHARAYFLSSFACMAASLLNPYTYHLHAHMAQYLRDPFNSQHIAEFLSPTFHHPMAMFFEAMLVLSVATAIWSASRGRFAEPLLMLVWAHGSLLAARNIPIFMIAAAPPVAAAIQEWLLLLPGIGVAAWLRNAGRKFNGLAADMGETERLGRWHLLSAAGVLLVAAMLYAPHPPKKFRSEFDPSSYPAGALATLRQDPNARIFTHDEWGDYLIWTGHKVFVDGRSDFYGDDFEERYIDVLNVKYGWEKTLDGFGVDTILMPPAAPLTGALKESSRWQVAYDDGIAVVFRATQKAGSAAASVTAAGNGDGVGRETGKSQARELPVIRTDLTLRGTGLKLRGSNPKIGI
ncbi:MAG TPA: hypothetical protein VNY05_04365 [Candidatus Acidoferrales bacterium]|nr:hypothetical protein [Candidatus Acidoferrales bacterium]